MADFLSGNGFPNTGSNIDSGHRTNSGLSTQIIIKVGKTPVGALQTLTVNQVRGLQTISEIGTDGVIEIVPNTATKFTLQASRMVFDQLRLPEAFSRGFRFISAQRVPFDIEIIDISGTSPNDINDTGNQVIMTYKNCWFASYDTPYQAADYLITESASIQCETGYLVQVGNDGPAAGRRGMETQTDRAGIETAVNSGRRLGSLDAAGLVMSLFEDDA